MEIVKISFQVIEAKLTKFIFYSVIVKRNRRKMYSSYYSYYFIQTFLIMQS